MKNLKFLLAFIVAAVLSSCLDAEEEIVLRDDNSGFFCMTMDVGRVFHMENFMEADKADPEKVKKKENHRLSKRLG